MGGSRLVSSPLGKWSQESITKGNSMGLKVNIDLIKDLQTIYLAAHQCRKLLVGILDEENQQYMYEWMSTN
jgi:hypothetical protein